MWRRPTRAVAELRDVGIPAATIASLALDLNERPPAPNTVIILDELSQTATTDAEVVLAAVAGAPRAQLWCLGDVRQAQAVRAGGLAAQVDRLGTEGLIPAGALTENHRQTNPAEREALAAWRAGELPSSQVIRTGAGLEHETETPFDTREAMAGAVTADVLAHGARGVVALAVSHADCEDVADRIRARLLAHGVITGSVLEGPGWAGGDGRQYQAGDRVLLHTNLRVGGTKLANGTALTVTGVGSDGLAVTDDHNRRHLLPATFVADIGPGGRPNVSHAWCRTVDGSQGGTWDRAHLLGTAGLDNFSAYVGQSRARIETHTWNVRRLPLGDWGGRLADQRSGARQVLDAAGRAPLKTFAAHDDPWALDRQLREEIATHEAVLVAVPPDVSADLSLVREQLQRAERAVADAHTRITHAERQVAAVTPVAALRRSGRELRDRWGHAADLARRDFENAAAEATQARARADHLAMADADRQAWLEREGWRAGRVMDARLELDRHWARTVVGAVTQGDPLAFGIDRLRAARAALAANVRRLDASLPPDRSGQLDYAEQCLHNAQAILRHAERDRDQAARRLQQAEVRRLGRRDEPAIASCTQLLAAAERAAERAAVEVSRAEAKVYTEREAVSARATAEAALQDPRRALVHDLRAVEHAMEATRSERVQAAAAGDPGGAELRDLLGEPPADCRGREVWCSMASRTDMAIANIGSKDAGSRSYLDHLVHRSLRDPQAAGELKAHVERAVAAALHPMSTPAPVGPINAEWLSPGMSPQRPHVDHGVDLGL